ncbi:ubiquitin thioesterase OTU1-like isoform X4 [Camellia sinensis]|uniref:ubiquitin thioesterase OTU1-like isoform X4 n=1 Tax=Camellia sinensis TaxID=4442 RepID=UPI001035DA81|nr:ubiquitin thioesterase OTU1-like isoform X4 [Camellia sinensis]
MEGTIVRRVIPSDNSCLFNAVGYVMDHDKHKAPQLRQVIAATVASDPTQYSEAFLGKPNEEYRAWILNPEKWGELLHPKYPRCGNHRITVHCGSISSLHKVVPLSLQYWQIIMDVKLQHTISKPQDVICMGRLALVMCCHVHLKLISFYNGAPEEFDQTIFTVQKDRTIGPIERLALNLAKEQQRKRSYTDTANFTLRCEVCQIGVVGQKGAMKHAQATGHVNFQEFR